MLYKRDKKAQGKLSKENKMDPSKVPDALKDLKQVEEVLISQVFPVMQIHTETNGGQQAYKDDVITLPNNVKKLADILSRHPKDIPVMIVLSSMTKIINLRKRKVVGKVLKTL